MIWAYRAVNNKIARKKWILFSFSLIILALIVSFVRLTSGAEVKKIALSLVIFVFVVILYMLITLGKVRYYFIEGDTIYYKPFKTKMNEVSGFEVDEKNLVIRLKFKKPKIIGVKTLYFENEEDLKKVKNILDDLTQNS